jgi:hypothetical protein
MGIQQIESIQCTDDQPDENDYCAKNVHHMFVDITNGVKTLKRRVGGNVEVLPALPTIEAAKALLEYLGSIGSQLILCYHGEDHTSLLPYLASCGLEKQFQELVWHMLDTRQFFVEVQEGRRVGMKTIVRDWAPPEIKLKYSMGAHSSAVDAEALGVICYQKEIASRFEDWISMTTE